MESLTSYGNGIYAIDSGYQRPYMAAIHLIVERGRAAFFDSGCNASLPTVLEVLKRLGLAADAVDYVIVSHVHLDHAGGAGSMMQAFPEARLVVHPRGARHMADPSRLMEGTIAVYGAEKAERLYGTIQPIAAERMIEATDGLTLDLAGRELLCLDTPGHARHHIALVDRQARCVFSGDDFGISYPETDTDGRQLIFPTTTPVQLEPEAMHATIDRLLGYDPTAVYLTHYGQLRDVAARAADLHRLIDAHVSAALEADTGEPGREARIRQALAKQLLGECARVGCPLLPEQVLEVYGSDLTLNAQGLEVWLDSRARSKGPG